MNEIIKKIEEIAEESTKGYFGLRVLNDNYEDDIQVGDTLQSSYHQTDDMEEAEALDGTCAITIVDNQDSITDAINKLKIYAGKKIALISSLNHSDGYDLGEGIFRDAICEFIFNR